MFKKIFEKALIIMALCYFLAGCASTQPTMSVNHLEVKIARIEQKTDEQN